MLGRYLVFMGILENEDCMLQKIRSFLGHLLPAPAKTIHKMMDKVHAILNRQLLAEERINSAFEKHNSNAEFMMNIIDEQRLIIGKVVIALEEQQESLRNVLKYCEELGNKLQSYSIQNNKLIGNLNNLINENGKAISNIDDSLDENSKMISDIGNSLDKNSKTISNISNLLDESNVYHLNFEKILLEKIIQLDRNIYLKYLKILGTTEFNEKKKRMNINIERQMWEIAATTSAEYVLDKMYKTPSFLTKEDMLIHFAKEASSNGLFLEFGVFKGITINIIANCRPDVLVYGFDSFEGLPEDWRTGFTKNKFAANEPDNLKENIVLVNGWFDEVLPSFLNEHPGNCSFLHVDCDLYSSTRTAFENLCDRITPGTIIIFDEYYNYPSWERHEFKAFQEFVQLYNVEYEYVGYVPSYEQVAVKVTHINHTM